MMLTPVSSVSVCVEESTCPWLIAASRLPQATLITPTTTSKPQRWEKTWIVVNHGLEGWCYLGYKCVLSRNLLPTSLKLDSASVEVCGPGIVDPRKTGYSLRWLTHLLQRPRSSLILEKKAFSWMTYEAKRFWILFPLTTLLCLFVNKSLGNFAASLEVGQWVPSGPAVLYQEKEAAMMGQI